ncbi:type II secretion system F family protein [Enterovirga rhinocerotis]|uniref:Tight adherence protein B n=1 Tax=Enterovirga rhinocerotis TaxID=1339210 RepID=A0A4R7CCY9_9HYPH|nr:type II secretion system F family protein [Enterovirga rhinocerotis]TDR94687.1 tight adherence protein B [Enterovirga rhinocerotis]
MAWPAMDLTTVAVALLSAASAGGLAYVFLYPALSGEARAEKRQKTFVGSTAARVERVTGAQNRRDQVAQSLKELEQREKARHKLTLEARIAQAGLDWSKSKFLLISALLGAGMGLVLFLITNGWMGLVAGLFIGGLGLPRWILGYLKNRRISRYLEELPNAMDVIVRGIKAGLPLNDCLRMIAAEAQEPVRSEFKAIVDEQALGVPIADAVAKLYDRVPVAESTFFAIVISIQAKAGGNLSETLGNLSRVLRDRKKMKAKVQAMSQEAKASAMIIAALPFMVALMTYLSSPKYIELLWITDVGKVALVCCAVWMTIGVLVMRKMINFEI